MIYNKEVYGDKFTLKCESWNTRNSWGHEVTLYHNGTKIGRVKVRYYNRTWESYQYQNAIKSVIFNAMEQIKWVQKKMFLIVNNYKIMTKKREGAFLEFLKRDYVYNQYNRLYQMF